MKRQGKKATPTWPVLLLCLPAFTAIWGGWVGLGEKTGFGEINLLPGMVADGQWSTINTAVTLPIGLETYAAYALHAALNSYRAGMLRTFAIRSAIAALVLGGAGQLAYHILDAAGMKVAPWWITAIVATIPVAVLGAGTALAALIRRENAELEPEAARAPRELLPIVPLAPETEVLQRAGLLRMDLPAAATAEAEQMPQVEQREEVQPRERAPRAASGDLQLRVKEMVEQGFPFAVDNKASGASTLRKYAKVARQLYADAAAPVDYTGERVNKDVVESVIRPAMNRERIR